jgi:alkanesulfonate monooxygenase SsuD/methylene tetrahydromethanopterin reductase-like flavin-dependent oxidoreductase (luciferase family)
MLSERFEEIAGASMAAGQNLTPRDIHPWVAASQNATKFAVSIYPQPPDWQHYIGLVQQMEAKGIDAYFAYDHPEANTDCWTSLAALAASTSTIRLGTLVDCIYYRSPYLLARQAADIDRLSGGRLILGLGIGDNVPEFEQMGIPFPPTRDRLAAMEETIAILRGLWSGEPFSFEGQHFGASTPGGFLPPVQEPRVPILLAGGGEKVTLRQVAQFADASNMGAHDWIGGAVTSDDIQRKFAKLREYLERFDRPHDAVLRTHFTMTLVLERTPDLVRDKMAWLTEKYGQEKIDWCGKALFAGTPEEAVAFYTSLKQAGFQYFIANIFEGDDVTIDLMGEELVPAFS